jgi:hypothetical protein
MRLIMRIILLGLCLLVALPVSAGPMGFQGSWMTMSDLGPNWREVFTNYALTPRDAVGVSQTYMRSDDKTQSRDVTEITYTRLVARWNQADSQSNIWFIGGMGFVDINDESQESLFSPGISADYPKKIS